MPPDNNSTATSPEKAARADARQGKWSNLSKILKIALTLLIFGFVVRSVDLSTAWENVANQNLPLVALAAVVLVFQIGLGGTRWLIILRNLDARPALWETLKLFYVSIFFNSYVWGGISGDVVRAWLSYRSNISGKTAITSVVLDRVAALAGVASLVLLTAPFFRYRVGASTPLLVLIVVSIAGLVAILVAAQFERLPARWLRFRALSLLQVLGGSVRKVFLNPGSVLPILGVAVLSQTVLGVVTYIMASSLDMNVTLLECVVLMQPVALVANLPISVGGWGVRETAMITLFGMIGVPASSTLVLSVQLGLLSLLVALPGGLLWLAFKSKAPSLSVASSPGP
jgi:glycosyltransferase 2 family protein